MEIPRHVYLIQHNVTKKSYVGSSGRLGLRISSHFSALHNHKHPVEDMQADCDNYGFDFTVKILEVIDQYSDKDKEYEWMKRFRSDEREFGYNYKDQALHPHYNRCEPKYVYTYNGKTQLLSEWAKELGLSYDLLYGRLVTHHWAVDKAFTTPAREMGGSYYAKYKRN